MEIVIGIASLIVAIIFGYLQLIESKKQTQLEIKPFKKIVEIVVIDDYFRQ